MAWKQISECLPAELTARMELEKAGAAKAPASCQETKGAETPASLPAYKGHTDRSIIVARPTRLPTSAAVIDLCAWKSSRTTEGRSLSRPAYRRNPRAEPRGIVVKLVVG